MAPLDRANVALDADQAYFARCLVQINPSISGLLLSKTLNLQFTLHHLVNQRIDEEVEG